jgi:putative NADH-flavin reductase
VIPCARTGTVPPMGSTVGENGSLKVPSEFTFEDFSIVLLDEVETARNVKGRFTVGY